MQTIAIIIVPKFLTIQIIIKQLNTLKYYTIVLSYCL